jgi:hypothetical protein
MNESRRLTRRDFLELTALASGGLLTRVSRANPITAGHRIHWTRECGLFSAVSCDALPMAPTHELIDASIRLATEAPAQATRLSVSRPAIQDAPFRSDLRHELFDSGNGMGEDVLEATLTVQNTTSIPQCVDAEFITAVQPSSRVDEQHVYVPLNAAGFSGDQRFSALGMKSFFKDGDLNVGAANIQCNYLEPMASYASERETRALLLAPVLDINHPQVPWHVALFTPSDQPMRFRCNGGTWRAGREISVPAGGRITQRCWLMLHTGDALVPWRAFHRFAHKEDFAVPDWVREMKVQYYDYLSSADGENGRRGDGYEADLAYFREFQVGLAIQHGYYLAIGDYIHPDRKTWLAMRGDKHGAVEMSFDKMIARIKATRKAGSRAAVYVHPALFDDAAPCFAKLRDCVQVNAQGQRIAYDWTGPDTAGKNWRSSLASPQWREHLLQQAGWIMDILQPDAIVVDETLVGLGYDYRSGRAEVTSSAAIEFYRKLRFLVRSFGQDKAFFSSDCSLSSFVLWADGECGDHAYPNLLGDPHYTQEPVRYLAALGNKLWLPCAWSFQGMWEAQMKLARQVGSGVGVSNGWIEYTGLTRLPDTIRKHMIADIGNLTARRPISRWQDDGLRATLRLRV